MESGSSPSPEFFSQEKLNQLDKSELIRHIQDLYRCVAEAPKNQAVFVEKKKWHAQGGEAPLKREKLDDTAVEMGSENPQQKNNKILSVLKEKTNVSNNNNSKEEKQNTNPEKTGSMQQQQQPKKKKKKDFDPTRYQTRHIALQIAYMGWNYHGIAYQPTDLQTVEEVLFTALERIKLIQSRDSCKYTRAGRTDRGVSAIGNVVAFHARSNLKKSLNSESTSLTSPNSTNSDLTLTRPTTEPNSTFETTDKTLEEPKHLQPNQNKNINSKITNTKKETTQNSSQQEMDYVKAINSALPPEVRVLAWAPVAENFNARFSCQSRSYKYFFLSKGLDVPLMQQACKRFVCGERDFRNFCKMDHVNVMNYKRQVLSFDIQPVTEMKSSDPNNQLYVMNIKGTAFLWHQVRCMSAILFMVGQHNEEPDIIDRLLDIEKMPRKPHYEIASDTPLILYHCEYPNLEWKSSPESQSLLYRSLYQNWMEYMLKTNMIMTCFLPVEQNLVTGIENKDVAETWNPLCTRAPRMKHQPLLQRSTEDSLEEKKSKLKGKNQERHHNMKSAYEKMKERGLLKETFEDE